MPIKYVQTLGAVAGYEQVVNEVVITCQKPSEFVVKAKKNEGIKLTVKPKVVPRGV